MRYQLPALAALIAMPAIAETCVPYPSMVEQLAGKYGETRIFVGLMASGTALIEVYGNNATGTWTVIAVDPSGTACMKAAGENYHEEAGLPGNPT